MAGLDDSLLTDSEAAVILRMHRGRVVQMAKRGEIPHVLLPDGQIRFIANDLAEWVANFVVPQKAERPRKGKE